jgi:tRNA 2-thiouridine synthesizing protein D
MKFVIQVNSGPYQSGGSDTAYQFIRAAQQAGHEILRVFFYHDGVHNASARATAPEDEQQPARRWSALAAETGVDLVVCISAAQRRGLVGPDAEVGVASEDTGLAPGFRIAGLGLWVDACLKADRFLVFGG